LSKVLFDEGAVKGESGNLLESNRLLRRASSLFKSSRDAKGYAECCYRLAHNYQQLFRWEKTIYYLNLSKRLYKLSEDWENYAFSKCELGFLYLDLCKYKEAHQIFTDLENMYGVEDKRFSLLLLSKVVEGKALYFQLRGYFNEAIPLHKESYDLRRSLIGNHPHEVKELAANSLDHMGFCLIESDKFEDGHRVLIAASKLREQLPFQEPVNQIRSLLNLGTYDGLIGKFQKQCDKYFRALKLARRMLGESHFVTADCYEQLGYCFGNLGQYEKVFRYHSKALSIRKIIFGDKHVLVLQSINNLGFYHRKKGDFAEALRIHEETLNADNGTTIPDFLKARTYFNMGICHRQMGKFQKAIECHQQSNTYREKIYGESHRYIAGNLNHIGHCLEAQKDLDGALKFYRQALYIRERLWNVPHRQIAKCHISISNIYFQKQAFDDALDYARLALEIQQQVFENEQHPEIISSYNHIANCYHQKEDYNRALQYFQIAINLSCLEFNNPDVFQNPELTDYLDAIKLLNALAGKAYSFVQQYKVSKDEQALAGSFESFQLSIALIEKIRSTHISDQSKLLLIENVTQIYEQAIDVAYTLFQLKRESIYASKAFDFSEQTKAILLLETLTNVSIDEEKAIVPQSHFAEIQSELKSSTAFVEYFLGQNHLYIFMIESGSSQPFIHKTKVPDNVESLVENLRIAITDKDTGSLKKWSPQLHELLIAPIEQFIANKKRLVIIPDNILFKIPFEVLFGKEQEQTKMTDLPMLINRYEFIYHYSASLLLHTIKHRRETKDLSSESALVVAPGIFEDPNLKNLANLLDNMVLKISERKMDVTTLFAEQATKENFKKQLEKGSKYLLMFTHGLTDTDGSNPQIKFYKNEEMAVSELYEQNCQADLVILCSCKSGIGPFKGREGMIAFNRAFMHTGVSNVLYSLFNILQSFSMELIEEFCLNIFRGKNYPEALQQAKLKLIKKGYSPIHWCGFTLIGSWAASPDL